MSISLLWFIISVLLAFAAGVYLGAWYIGKSAAKAMEPVFKRLLAEQGYEIVEGKITPL